MAQTQDTNGSTAVSDAPVMTTEQSAVESSDGRPLGDVIIRTKGLSKVYRPLFAREGKTALHGLDIDVRQGEIFGLVGPNGSGKTTSLKLLLGLIKPSGGEISIFGRGPRDVAVKKRIGFLPDGPYFYDHLDSYEILDFYAKLFGYSDAERKERIPRLLDIVGLKPEDRKRVIRTYSKGMVQRVGLAQALINDPELLFLDEPTTGLDPIGARGMKDAILAQRDAGKTVLVCSHLLADVQAICDRVAILSEGKLVKFGTVRELVGPSQTFEIFARNMDAEAPSRAAAAGYAFEQDSDHVLLRAASAEQLDEVLRFVRDANGKVIDVKGHSETLEDVFVRSVKSDGR